MMPQRLAACMALTAFALCLLVGAFGAGNSFDTVVLRALVAMAGTYVIGLVLGLMGRKMIDENVKAEEARMRKSTELEASDR